MVLLQARLRASMIYLLMRLMGTLINWPHPASK